MTGGGPKRHWELGAVERIQKAKRAKNVKQFARRKQRRRLAEELEERNDSAIVAAELGIPGARVDELEQELLQKAPRKKPKQKDIQRKGREENAEVEAEPGTAGSDIERNVVSSEGASANAPATEGGKDADGWMTVKRKRFPFQKELKLREAARLEREKERERFEEERKAYFQRREESRKARKKGGKQFRKVTRRGQPVLRHRIDALLQDIQKK